jgi:hypothetical protein
LLSHDGETHFYDKEWKTKQNKKILFGNSQNKNKRYFGQIQILIEMTKMSFC